MNINDLIKNQFNLIDRICRISFCDGKLNIYKVNNYKTYTNTPRYIERKYHIFHLNINVDMICDKCKEIRNWFCLCLSLQIGDTFEKLKEEFILKFSN